MNIANRVEYLPADETRQKIPWVRATDSKGNVKIYTTPGFTNQVVEADIRTMDCMDCHNRPAHRYIAPNDAVDLMISLGRIDRTVPWIKSNAVHALTADYKTQAEAMKGIADHLTHAYPDRPQIKPAIDAVQQVYRENFFPLMKANWQVYPDNSSHMYWPGCFRCHDGKHLTADGKASIKSSDCNSCHTILAQGKDEDLNKLNVEGAKFAHPGDELDPNPVCHECHTGGP
jgi:hypothetical protein